MLRTSWACLLASGALTCCATGTRAATDYRELGAGLKVRSGHPVLFVNAELVQKVRAQPERCKALSDTVTRYRMKATRDPQDTDAIRKEVAAFADCTHPGGYLQASMWYGTVAYVNQDPLATAYAREYLRAIIDIGIEAAKSPESHALGRAFAIGTLYDWVYADLDEDLKHQARVALVETADALGTKWHFLDTTSGYIGGHASCWANPYLLVGLLAIRHDIGNEPPELQTRYFEWLGKVAFNIRDGVAPAHEWICKDGGYHMGWAYGTCYTVMLPYLAWDFATEEPSLFTDWQNQHVFWYVYGLRHQAQVTHRDQPELVRKAYGLNPQSGDCYDGSTLSGAPQEVLLATVCRYNNPYAKWLLSYYTPPSGDPSSWHTLLYGGFDAADGTPPDALPLSRCFRNTGFVVMRDTWDLDRNTQAVFKSTPFFSNNHHHRDQNSFVIYYKAPLAIDSGGYNNCGAYGGRHWFNYYTRSIAHNTILIYDPKEDFGSNSKWGKNSNDGGQAFVRPEAGTLADILPGGKCAMDGILRYEDRPDYTYTLGDATKAYSPHKLELFQRHVVYLRRHSGDHPAIVVYDKVVAKDAAFRKTFLLHTIAQPTIEGKTFWTEGSDGMDPNNRGRLYDQVLLPEDAVVNAIGGVANNQEFYVADDGTGQPHNYREELVAWNAQIAAQEPCDREQGFARELGGWRVEVSPGAARLEDTFINVLSVTDGGDQAKPVQAEHQRSEQFDSVAVRDSDGLESTLVAFRRGGRGVAPLQDATLPASGCRKALLLGLAPSQTLGVAVKDSALVLAAQPPEGAKTHTTSDQGTLFLDLGPGL